MINKQLEQLETQLLEIENKMEENDDFTYGEEYRAAIDKIDSDLQEFEDMMPRAPLFDTEESEDEFHMWLKELKQIKSRFKKIMEEGGIVSEDDIEEMMFPNRDDD